MEKDWRTPRVVKYILRQTGKRNLLRGRAGKPVVITNIFEQ